MKYCRYIISKENYRAKADNNLLKAMSSRRKIAMIYLILAYESN